MKMKQSIDYIFLQSGFTGMGYIRIEKQNVAGIQTLMVEIPVHKKELSKESVSDNCLMKMKKRLCRKLRHYSLSVSAVNGEGFFQKYLLKENIGFKARKAELLIRGNVIFTWLYPKFAKNKRRRLLVYVESRNWEEWEIYKIICMAKNDYEDIVVFCEDFAWFEDMAGKLFEESGLMISFTDMKHIKTEHYESVIFLVQEWREWYRKRLCFELAYVVAEQENIMFKFRKMKKGTGEGRSWGNGECYSGLCYECNNRKIPYQMAVDLLYQKPAFCEKIGISSVAIYCLECYNIEKYCE